MAEVVADASVLIALVQIGRLALLQSLFEDVVIPAAVAREVLPSLPEIPAWIQTRAAPTPLDARVLAASIQERQRRSPSRSTPESEGSSSTISLPGAWR